MFHSFGESQLAINTSMHHRLVVYIFDVLTTFLQCPYNTWVLALKTQSSLAYWFFAKCYIPQHYLK